VDKYVEALTSGLIFYGVNRRDIKGKQLLQTLGKYYVADLGFRRALLGNSKSPDLGYLLENVVYFELLRRGNVVHIGKHGEEEIDFIAKNPETNEIIYYQVSDTITHPETLQRELKPFTSIHDNYEKILLTTDIHEGNYDGIKQVNVINWLLQSE
jgi:predicted AAA+ superfamily ATPase